MAQSPLDLHVASPRELQARVAADRGGHPFLVYRTADDRQVIVVLDPGRERLTVGRGERSDIRLPSDTQVSRVHAAIERVGDEWLISDDGLSRNGTRVNGERVTSRRRLRDGDVIAVGSTTLAFCAPSEDGADATASVRGPTLGDLLSPAQRRVLIALCRPYREGGYSVPATNQQIADELVVSVDAVKSTLTALFTAFGIDQLPQNQKRATLAVQALRNGIVARRDL